MKLIYRVITNGTVFRVQRKIWRGWKTETRLTGVPEYSYYVPISFETVQGAKEFIREEVRDRKVRASKWTIVETCDYGTLG